MVNQNQMLRPKAEGIAETCRKMQSIAIQKWRRWALPDIEGWGRSVKLFFSRKGEWIVAVER